MIQPLPALPADPAPPRAPARAAKREEDRAAFDAALELAVRQTVPPPPPRSREPSAGPPGPSGGNPAEAGAEPGASGGSVTPRTAPSAASQAVKTVPGSVAAGNPAGAVADSPSGPVIPRTAPSAASQAAKTVPGSVAAVVLNPLPVAVGPEVGVAAPGQPNAAKAGHEPASGPAGTPAAAAAPVVASAPDQAPEQRETNKPSRDETAAAPGRNANPAAAPAAPVPTAAPVADPAPRIQLTLTHAGTPAPAAPTRPAAVPLPPPPRPAEQVTVPLVNESGMAGRLRLSLRGEVLHATIFAADRATAGALRDGLGDLRRGLAERGFADAHVVVREGPAAPDLKHTPSRDPARDHSSDPHTPEEHRRDDRSGTLPRDGRRRSPREGAERQDR